MLVVNNAMLTCIRLTKTEILPKLRQSNLKGLSNKGKL